MMDAAPAPSKRPFGYPLPAEAVEYFIHPGGEPDFEAAGMDGETAIAANGYMAAKIETYLDLPPAPPRMIKRVGTLPWGDFAKWADDDRWRSLGVVSSTLFRYGPRPIWERTRSSYYIRRAPVVRVGVAGITTLALLQLCARLPRAEVWAETSAGKSLLVRFNGGQVILPYFDKLEPPAFTIFAPRISR